MAPHPTEEAFFDPAEFLLQGVQLGNPDLPIALVREELEDSLHDNTLTVIKAGTGTGKSTQVVQYLEQMRLEGRIDIEQIILTQPRVLSARELAGRIDDEFRLAGVDSMAGYSTQPERSPLPQRSYQVAVLTEGKAAMQERHRTAEDSEKLRYLVIDEVHEFGKFTELLLAIAKRKTDPKSPHYDKNLRVVVMSATHDEKRMIDYFSHTSTGYINVDVPTYPIEVLKPTKEKAATVALKIAVDMKEKGIENSVVLTFMAGKGEIASAKEAIEKMQEHLDPEERISVVALHAQQNAEQQQLAVNTAYKNGVIVLSTNVAETSITVPNVVAVVDTAEVRIAKARFDIVPTGSQELNLEHAARSSMTQRAGRAGRTQPGVSIVAKQMGGEPTPFEHRFRKDYPRASIEIDEVDDLLLFVKSIGSELSDFTFFHKIPERAIKAAQAKLFTLGAIDEEGVITARGEVMANLPLNPEFACMVAYAKERRFNEEVQQNVMDIVAIMQRGGIFSRSPSEKNWKRLLARDAKTGAPIENESDYIAQLEGYVSLLQQPLETWHTFDVNVYAAEKIRDRRESLAKSLGITNLGPATKVEQRNREAVLSCIYAGQLAQIYQRNRSNGEWQLNTNSKTVLRPHPTSVAGMVGRYATGSAFSVGTYGKYEHAVQDINRVLNVEILADVAKHLVQVEVIEGSEYFVPEKQAMFVRVRRRLGNIMLKEKTQVVDTNGDHAMLKMLADAYAEHVVAQHIAELKQNDSSDHRHLQYQDDELEELILNPETMEIGKNIYDDNRPIVVYLGKGMRPMDSREAAVASLTAQKARIEKAPTKAIQREIKAGIRSASVVVRKIATCGVPELEARALALKKGPNEQSRLDAMHALIDECNNL